MQSWLPSGCRNSPSASSHCHREVLQPLLRHPDRQKDLAAMGHAMPSIPAGQCARPPHPILLTAPAQTTFTGKTTYGPERNTCTWPSGGNPRSFTAGHLLLEVPQGLKVHRGQLKEYFNYRLSLGKTVHSVHRDPRGNT